LRTSSPELGTPTLTINAGNRCRPKKRRKKSGAKNRRHRS
jgi:hypothetical protein